MELCILWNIMSGIIKSVIQALQCSHKDLITGTYTGTIIK